MELITRILQTIIPKSIRRRYVYRFLIKGYEQERLCSDIADRISRANHCRVLFIASMLSMWRYQGIVDLLRRDGRFDVRIIICPFATIANASDRNSQVMALKSYFNSRGWPNVPSVTDEGFDLDTWFAGFDPDLIFYSQHYPDIYNNILEYRRNRHRLWGYVPYGLITMKNRIVYDSEFQWLAWRLYDATQLHRHTARNITRNFGRNVRVVGEPHADEYLGTRGADPWRSIGDGKQRKRIIWSPHFSIEHDSPLQRASFLWLYDAMPELARRYSDTVQFAFKPHPRLYDTLCCCWGKERTDRYYRMWAEMPNTQLETGEFVELFMHSDGMIHDCGSFTGEYLFARKPVMFMSRRFEAVREDADDFGLRCLDLHYVGKSPADAEMFIKDIVLAGDDRMKYGRDEFFNNYLLPPNGMTMAENVYRDLVKSLGLHIPQ